MSKILTYDNWCNREDSFTVIADKILSLPSDSYHFLGWEEAELTVNFSDICERYFHVYGNLSAEQISCAYRLRHYLRNKEFTIYTSGVDNGYFDYHREMGFQVKQYPLFYLTKTTYDLWSSLKRYKINFIKYLAKYQKMTKLYKPRRKEFICLNGVGRSHRVEFVNQLRERRYLELGYVSWYDPNYFQSDPRLGLLPSQLEFDARLNPNEYQALYPLEATNTKYAIITETHPHHIFITEKTVIPMLFGKPALILSGMGHHKFMQDLGFELYTEVFDYRFDELPTIQERIQGILDNIERVRHLNWDDVYWCLLPKIRHNAELTVTLAQDTAHYIRNECEHLGIQHLPRCVKWITNNPGEMPDWVNQRFPFIENFFDKKR